MKTPMLDHAPASDTVKEVKNRLLQLGCEEHFGGLWRHAEYLSPTAAAWAVESRCLCHLRPPDTRIAENSKTHSAAATPCCKAASKSWELKPSFFDLKVSATLPRRTRRQRQWAAHVHERMNLAERILVCCAAIRYPMPKPTATLICLIEMCRRRWEELDALDDLAKKTRRENCVRGGIKRHERHSQIKQECIPLLTSEAPSGGWLNKSHAGDVLAPLLIQRARQSGYDGSLDEGQWSRTIQGLIRADLRARDAYEKKRAARRGHRSTGPRGNGRGR